MEEAKKEASLRSGLEESGVVFNGAAKKSRKKEMCGRCGAKCCCVATKAKRKVAAH